MPNNRYLRLRELEIILKQKRLSISEIAKKYNISRYTAWRDIDFLSTIISIINENGKYFII